MKKENSKIQEMKNLLIQNGWSLKKEGLLYRSIHGKEYRFKFAAHSVRYETAYVVPGWEGKDEKKWLRLKSGYYKNITVSNGHITGLKH